MSYNDLLDKVHSYLSLLKEEGETRIEVSKRRSRFQVGPTSGPSSPAPQAAAPPARPPSPRPTEAPASPAKPLTMRIAERVEECGGAQKNTRLIWIGEAIEFEGAEGELLSKMLYAMGYRFSDESLRWRSEADTPTEAAALITLGQDVLNRVTGQRQSLAMMRGKPAPTASGGRVVPTYAPSYLNQNPAAKKAVWKDMLALLERKNLELPPWSQKFKK